MMNEVFAVCGPLVTYLELFERVIASEVLLKKLNTALSIEFAENKKVASTSNIIF